MLLRNCVKVEKVTDVLLPVQAILDRVGREQLMRQYGVGRFDTAHDFLTLVAARRGLLRKGGAFLFSRRAALGLASWRDALPDTQATVCRLLVA